MFTYLHVKNFKSLVDFTIDFRNKRNTSRKLNIIYGENGAGKSNIVEIFDFLKRMLVSRIAIPNFNIDDENPDIKKFLSLIINQHLIENVIEEYRTIENTEIMHIECGIKIDKTNYKYIIETNLERIVYEQLSIAEDKKDTCLYEISLKQRNINNISNNENYINDVSIELDKYWGKHSFLSIVLYEIRDKMVKYIKNNISKHILLIIGIFFEYNISKQINMYGINRVDKNVRLFLDDINSGNIKIEKQYILNTTEKVLNSIITSLYSDIKKVYYNIKVDKDEIEYKLYCKKMIGNKIIDIPFTRESTGTQKLFNLIPLFLSATDNHIVIIDEFDTGIHDLMVMALLENFAKHINGQLFLTTHNTTLMESAIKKDSIYILDILPNRKKEVYSLADYDEKIHPNLNIRKRYISGTYGGIPYANDINFDELEEIVKHAKQYSNKKK